VVQELGLSIAGDAVLCLVVLLLCNVCGVGHKIVPDVEVGGRCGVCCLCEALLDEGLSMGQPDFEVAGCLRK
jgi:hypothetical protein